MAQPHPKQSFLINVHPQVHSVCWPVNASNISIVWFRYNIFMYMKSFECIYMMYSVRYSSFMQIHAVPHISQNIPPIRDGSQPWDSPATAVPAAAASVFRTFSQLNVLNLVTGGAWWCLVGNSTKSRQFQWLSEKWTVWCGPFRVSTRNVWNKILQHVYMRISKNDINGAPPNMVFNGIPWAYFCTCVIFKSSCSKRAAKKKEKSSLLCHEMIPIIVATPGRLPRRLQILHPERPLAGQDGDCFARPDVVWVVVF